MDNPDRTRSGKTVVAIPDDLLPSLKGAAEQDLEWACDGPWDVERRQQVFRCVRVLDGLAAGTCTPKQLARVASSAVLWEEPLAGSWPRTVEDADDYIGRLERVKRLLELRERARAAG